MSTFKGVLLGFKYILLGMFLCFEILNFTGFSWNRLHWVPERELIDSAILYDYPGVYSNLDDLKKDYSTFRFEASYWKDWTGIAGSMFWNKFFGIRYYQVRLPDAVIFVDADGKARFSRHCGDETLCWTRMIPDHPALGIVGTVQYDTPNSKPATDFSVRWINGSTGTTLILGNCFSAFSTSEKPVLEISGPGHKAIEIERHYGYRLGDFSLTGDVEAKATGIWGSYSISKITESEFLKSQSCDQDARDAWPNIGGGAWKR